jgi:hypothetical protein
MLINFFVKDKFVFLHNKLKQIKWNSKRLVTQKTITH